MSDFGGAWINDSWIVSRRGEKNVVDPGVPYAWLIEKERTAKGTAEDTAIIFLTNRECPFHCLMCDLWKNTTNQTVPVGAIPAQIEYALKQLPEVKHLKLYNSGSFFDEHAIPAADYENIAALVSHFETVIVENHPRLINERCLRFRDMLKPELQIAMGLESVHPGVLKILNKRMTPQDFEAATQFLTAHGIRSRAFILLKPPFLSEDEGIYWAERSIDFAFQAGTECCIIIPVRSGNGAMDHLQEKGDFVPPDIRSLETVLEYGISLHSGRVFADTWDLHQFSRCDKCFEERNEKILLMNHHQKNIQREPCTCDKI